MKKTALIFTAVTTGLSALGAVLHSAEINTILEPSSGLADRFAPISVCMTAVAILTLVLFFVISFLVKGREKWWMFAATVVAVFLAWGSHFMWFTELWFDYAPFYNKFRTVSMALIVLQVTVPLLGFYTLDRIIKEKYTMQEFGKACLAAYALTGLFCLVCAIFPGIAGTFTGSVDAGQPDVLVEALIADRQTLLIKDAWHSFWFINIVVALIIWASFS
jgi:hypothetical protein